ncbi:MAG: TonB C-terminal domain-containing protein, partial [Candidatus Nanopelagicales bacterium]
RQEVARQEVARQEVARQEVARQEAARQEVARQEAARQEAARQEFARQEAARQEAVRQQDLQVAAARRDAAQRELARQELEREEERARQSARNELALQEQARQDAVREAARREQDRREADVRESARQEGLRQENAQPETMQRSQSGDQVATRRIPNEQNGQPSAKPGETGRRPEPGDLPRASGSAGGDAGSSRPNGAQAGGIGGRAAAGELGPGRGNGLSAVPAAVNGAPPGGIASVQPAVPSAQPAGRTLDAAPSVIASPVPAATPSEGRRKTLFARTDRDMVLAMYAEGWRQKIEMNARLDQLREASKQTHVDPVVTVSLRSDGSVEAVTFNRSSGVAEIDDAIRSIVTTLSPYSVFPPDVAREYDVLEIRRVWTFDVAVRLFAGGR